MHERVGFYGLDVYSLWDSLREIIAWLEDHAPEALPAALQAWQCLVPYREGPHEYAWSTRIVPENCEADVVALLTEVRRRTLDRAEDDPRRVGRGPQRDGRRRRRAVLPHHGRG